jgi:hypothetical protein
MKAPLFEVVIATHNRGSYKICRDIYIFWSCSPRGPEWGRCSAVLNRAYEYVTIMKTETAPKRRTRTPHWHGSTPENISQTLIICHFFNSVCTQNVYNLIFLLSIYQVICRNIKNIHASFLLLDTATNIQLPLQEIQLFYYCGYHFVVHNEV